MLKCFSMCTSVSQHTQARTAPRPGCGHGEELVCHCLMCTKNPLQGSSWWNIHLLHASFPTWLQKWQIIPKKCQAALLTGMDLLCSIPWYVTAPRSPFLPSSLHRDPPNANCIQMYWIRKDQRLTIIKQREPNTHPAFDCFFFYHLKILLKLLLP